ncbi:hypothetical protein OOT55_08210 [Marinimicrobium sp. C6131]|uniref:hypothetical protein n=1 Tax=Marinimicrobium sp. C6131 TaxID=3022676 RepID=UPI00223C9041|nr:hypothetical protein [Marinimicrobium sp. C6131]UZJ46019.1 hypothetical protein OOT55_08210 [Marinimicrobium sp. C6131]
MSEFFFPHQHVPAKDLFAAGDQEAIDRFLQQNAECRSGLYAHSPYCEGYGGVQDSFILNQLHQIPSSHREQLSCAIDEFGDDTHIIAEFYDRHLANLDLEATSTLVGAGATASGQRLTRFQRLLIDYQAALIKLNEYKYAGRAGMASKVELEAMARRKYATMARQYRAELNSIARPEFRNSNRGHILNNADRGITLARHHRRSKLSIDNVAQVQRLDRLARGVRFAGNGVLVLDAGVRLHSVHDSYQRNENWQRELALETTGFGFGGATGLWAGKGTVAALTALGLGSTPVGWVVMIGVGITAGFFAAKEGDSWGRQIAAWLFDR